MCKLKQDVQDSRISRIRVLEKSTARMQDTFSRARALSSKNARGTHPRAPAKQVKIRRSPPTEAALHPLCRWRSPDRHRDRIRRSCTTERRTRRTGPRAPFISPASPHPTFSTHDAQATQAPATDASSTSQAYHQTKPPQSDSNAQPQASQTYQ